jgi:hypothetical protein
MLIVAGALNVYWWIGGRVIAFFAVGWLSVAGPIENVFLDSRIFFPYLWSSHAIL